MQSHVNEVAKKVLAAKDKEIAQLREAVEMALNENFSGQSTLSPYAKRILDKSLTGRKENGQ